MPKIVDHEERRTSIARAAMLEIAENGIEDLRLKDVAERAGWTTGVLTHYFSNKEELLSEALKITFKEIVGEALAESRSDNHSVHELMRRWLPCFPGRLLGWQAWIAFVGSAQFSSPKRELHEEYYRLVKEEALRRLAAENVRMDVEDTADLMIAFMDGLSTRVIMEPDKWPAERQEALLETCLDCMIDRSTR